METQMSSGSVVNNDSYRLVGDKVLVRVGLGASSRITTGKIVATKPDKKTVLIQTDDKRVLVDAKPSETVGGAFVTNAFCPVGGGNKPETALKILGWKNVKLPN